MYAIQIDEHGGPEVMQYRQVADPVAGPGQILVRVLAAAVNWSDTMRRRNDPYPFATALPFIPGGEVAGTVEALGEGLAGPAVGTPVLALVGGDGSTGYAQYAVADAAMVIPVPDGVAMPDAASIMVAGGTAALMLAEVAHLRAGETVLVEGAGGGVGSYAIQLAKRVGATVIGAAGTEERRSAAHAFGADHVVDYTAPGWTDEVRSLCGGVGADVILECAGGSTLNEAFSTLAPFGRMVVYGYASGIPGALTPAEQHELFYRPVLNQTVSGFNIGLFFGLRTDIAAGALSRLLHDVAAGEVQVQVSTVLPLTEAEQAHRRLEARASTGKIVLEPWS